MTEYLVAYDYGTGGTWGFVTAESEDEVVRTFPQLTVVHQRPEWLTAQEEHLIRSTSSFSADDPKTYPVWVQALANDRKR
jgi:hypothetical protein